MNSQKNYIFEIMNLQLEYFVDNNDIRYQTKIMIKCSLKSVKHKSTIMEY